MALTDRICRSLTFTDKNFKRFDSRGLYLFITVRGKYWRMKYHCNDNEKVLSLGQYPEITLKTARTLAEEARISIANGVDPNDTKKSLKKELLKRADTSFESVARKREIEFSGKYKPKYAEKRMSRLERDVFPYIGAKSFDDITHQDMRGIINRILKRKAIDTAHRTLYQCNEVFQYAIANELCERNICIDLKGLLPPVKNGHLASITDPRKIGPLLRILDNYDGSEIVRIALKIAPLTFVRPMELRTAKWADIDLKNKKWSLVGKGDVPLIVPLSTQAVEHFNEIKPLTGHGIYVFPSLRNKVKGDRPMSDNAVLSALRRMDIPADQMCGHGFRAMARTVLDEVLEFEPHITEQQLGHVVRDPNGRAYNRTKHLPQRTVMMQRWADYLDGLKEVARRQSSLEVSTDDIGK